MLQALLAVGSKENRPAGAATEGASNCHVSCCLPHHQYFLNVTLLAFQLSIQDAQRQLWLLLCLEALFVCK
jgi:hypothetical protein